MGKAKKLKHVDFFKKKNEAMRTFGITKTSPQKLYPLFYQSVREGNYGLRKINSSDYFKSQQWTVADGQFQNVKSLVYDEMIAFDVSVEYVFD
jgi:hypothetical protein